MAIAALRLNQLVETKARILDAARDAVALSGWKDAQIALIAARAGVATGSVYRYFDSKADLYAQVLGLVSEREVAWSPRSSRRRDLRPNVWWTRFTPSRYGRCAAVVWPTR